MSDEAKLCLYGEQARPFVNKKLGSKVTMTIDAVITTISVDDHYDGEDSDKIPCVEFTIASVEGQKKAYENMDVNELEREINDVKEGRAESIYTQEHKKEGLRQQPFKNLGKQVAR